VYTRKNPVVCLFFLVDDVDFFFWSSWLICLPDLDGLLLRREIPAEKKKERKMITITFSNEMIL